MLCFIPLVILWSQQSSEAILKYFLTQAVGSYLFLIGGVRLIKLEGLFIILVIGSLVLKTGIAPLHFCYPIVAEGLGWWDFYLLRTAQKTGPIVLLSYRVKVFSGVYLLVAILSAIIGAVGGVNELALRKLLRYSSISHIGWVLLPIRKSRRGWVIYFLRYCLVLWTIIPSLDTKQVFHFNQLAGENIRFWAILTVGAGLFSLGGIPPLLGFIPKLIVFYDLRFTPEYFLLYLFIILNIITLFYYTRLRANLWIAKNRANITYKFNGFNFLSTRINLTGAAWVIIFIFRFMH